MREDPSVDFVFVRDAGRASPCRVSNNSKCRSDKFGRSRLLRVDQVWCESSWRSGHGCWYGQGGQATCTSGRHGVEGDSLTTRSGESETPPCPSLVGVRGGGPPRADHRESGRVGKPCRFGLDHRESARVGKPCLKGRCTNK